MSIDGAIGGEAACSLAAHGDIIESIPDGVLAQLLRDLPDGVIIADRAGDIVFWNAGATRLFGWTPEEAQGRPLSMIIPERLRERHDKGYHQTMETGETKYGEDSMLQVPALHREGHTFSIAFTVSMLFEPGYKAPYAIAAVLRDDTERWELRRQANRSANEAKSQPRTS